MKKPAVLVLSELKRFWRDPFQILMALIPFLAAGALRAAWLSLTPFLRERFGIDLEPYRNLAGAVVLQLPAFMMGACFGFLCLEDRDSGLFLPLEKSPGGASSYLALRSLLCAALSSAEAIIVHAIFGASLPAPAAGILATALLGPWVMAFVGVVPRNKVEGLSVAKALSVIDGGAALAFFPIGHWAWAAIILPSYAPGRAALATGFIAWAWTLLSLAQQAGLAWLFLRLFKRRAAAGGG